MEQHHERQPEDADAANQFADAAVPEDSLLRAEMFKRIQNDGRGDCLFFALAGEDLEMAEVLEIRRRVAEQLGTVPDTPHGMNGNGNRAAATLTQTPALDQAEAMKLVRGRDQVPNAIYAQMQAVPGVYAGPEELIQWCAVEGKSVLVVDAPHGQLVEYSGAESRVLLDLKAQPGDIEQLPKVMDAYEICLYKSINHFERIVGLM